MITNQRLLLNPDVTSPAVKPQGKDFILGFCEHTTEMVNTRMDAQSQTCGHACSALACFLTVKLQTSNCTLLN